MKNVTPVRSVTQRKTVPAVMSVIYVRLAILVKIRYHVVNVMSARAVFQLRTVRCAMCAIHAKIVIVDVMLVCLVFTASPVMSVMWCVMPAIYA